MASPSVHSSSSNSQASRPAKARRRLRIDRLPVGVRRVAAWTIEVSFVAISAIAPYQLGAFVNDRYGGDPVPMNPMIAATDETIARTLAIPRRDRPGGIAPMTNIVWSIAVIAPVVVGGAQLYRLAKTGQTDPKAWFKLRVVTGNYQSPGFTGVILREGVGRWGIPLGLAYLIWRYSGAFPGLGILGGLAGVFMLAEAASAKFDREGRPFHDRLAHTRVVDTTQPIAASAAATVVYPPGYRDDPEVMYQLDENGAMTAIVLSPASANQRGLWHWMQVHPGTTVIIAAISGMTLILGTFIGTQVYVQHQANWREVRAQDDQVYMSLVEKISASTQKPIAERQAAILAMGTIQDPRAIPLLVDMLAQETNPAIMDTIQQAVVTIGVAAIPDLQRLNQALDSDLTTRDQNGNPANQTVLIQRQRTTQRAIAKILNLYSGSLYPLDLSRTNLNRAAAGTPSFTLLLDQTNLGGVNLRGSQMIGASLRGTQFFHPGGDRRYGTYDDQPADLSGAGLKEADLTGANLERTTLVRANLISSILDRANLQEVQAIGSNFSSARMIQADLQQAVLDEASFTGADLGNVVADFARMPATRLSQASAVGASFSSAILTDSDWTDADLTNAKLDNARLQTANFTNARLIDADLRGANLKEASFRGATLTGILLQGANLTDVDFQGAVFAPASPDETGFVATTAAESSNLRGVNFNGALNLDEAQLQFICAQGGLHDQCAALVPDESADTDEVSSAGEVIVPPDRPSAPAAPDVPSFSR